MVVVAVAVVVAIIIIICVVVHNLVPGERPATFSVVLLLSSSLSMSDGLVAVKFKLVGVFVVATLCNCCDASVGLNVVAVPATL